MNHIGIRKCLCIIYIFQNNVAGTVDSAEDDAGALLVLIQGSRSVIIILRRI